MYEIKIKINRLIAISCHIFSHTVRLGSFIFSYVSGIAGKSIAVHLIQTLFNPRGDQSSFRGRFVLKHDFKEFFIIKTIQTERIITVKYNFLIFYLIFYFSTILTTYKGLEISEFLRVLIILIKTRLYLLSVQLKVSILIRLTLPKHAFYYSSYTM